MYTLDDLRNDNQSLRRRVAELEKERNEISATAVDSIKALVENHKADIDTYKAEQNLLGVAISTLTADKKKQAEEIEKLKREYKQFERAVSEDERQDKNEIERLTAQIEALEKK